MIELKTCNTCGETKKLNDFYSYEKNGKNGIYIYYMPYCKECNKEKNRKWAKDNPEKRYESKMKSDHKPEMITKKRQWSKESRERGVQKRWQQENKDKLKTYRYKRQNKNHDITTEEWNYCKEYFDNECAYCNLHISEHFNMYAGELKWTDFHKEHVIHEGVDDLSNCVPSCKNCNSEKWEFQLEEWYNENNPFFNIDNLNKIKQWLEYDYKKYIVAKDTVLYEK